MDASTYSNIFETKGIEYIIIIAFFLLLIPFWFFVNRPKQFEALLQQSFATLGEAVLNIPKGVLVGKNHTWVQLNQIGLAAIGIDQWLQQITGNASITPLKQVGDHVNKGEPITKIEINGKSLLIYAPISGIIRDTNIQIHEVNQLASKELVKGWLYRMEPKQWKQESKLMYSANRANKWLQGEIDRFKDFLAVSFSQNTPLEPILVMQDGGEIIKHSLAELSQEIWEDFQKEFLNV